LELQRGHNTKRSRRRRKKKKKEERRRRISRSYDNQFFSFCFPCCAEFIVHYFTLKLKKVKLSLSTPCRYRGEVFAPLILNLFARCR
jgi:hypothetical protein